LQRGLEAGAQPISERPESYSRVDLDRLDQLHRIDRKQDGLFVTWEDDARRVWPAISAELRKYRAQVDAVRALATQWATQPTDYDEDTEQQIADGLALLDILD